MKRQTFNLEIFSILGLNIMLITQEIWLSAVSPLFFFKEMVPIIIVVVILFIILIGVIFLYIYSIRNDFFIEKK